MKSGLFHEWFVNGEYNNAKLIKTNNSREIIVEKNIGISNIAYNCWYDGYIINFDNSKEIWKKLSSQEILAYELLSDYDLSVSKIIGLVHLNDGITKKTLNVIETNNGSSFGEIDLLMYDWNTLKKIIENFLLTLVGLTKLGISVYSPEIDQDCFFNEKKSLQLATLHNCSIENVDDALKSNSDAGVRLLLFVLSVFYPSIGLGDELFKKAKFLNITRGIDDPKYPILYGNPTPLPELLKELQNHNYNEDELDFDP